MSKRIRIPIKIKRTVKTRVTTSVIRVTHSGTVCCVNCNRDNHVYAGQTNPVCGNCGYPLPIPIS